MAKSKEEKPKPKNVNLGARKNNTNASKYDESNPKIAQALCELGATDRELAAFFEVDITTIWHWQSKHPEFFKALRRGKEAADDRVERALYSRATGYSFDSEKIFCTEGLITRVPSVEHVPPDVTACIFWLKNRRAGEWRDVHKIEADHNHTLKLFGTGEMTVEQAQALFRQVQSTPTRQLQQQVMKLLEPPKDKDAA